MAKITYAISFAFLSFNVYSMEIQDEVVKYFNNKQSEIINLIEERRGNESELTAQEIAIVQQTNPMEYFNDYKYRSLIFNCESDELLNYIFQSVYNVNGIETVFGLLSLKHIGDTFFTRIVNMHFCKSLKTVCNYYINSTNKTCRQRIRFEDFLLNPNQIVTVVTSSFINESKTENTLRTLMETIYKLYGKDFADFMVRHALDYLYRELLHVFINRNILNVLNTYSYTPNTLILVKEISDSRMIYSISGFFSVNGHLPKKFF
ncbi:MAG: hypothetical protein IJ481_01845 [Alphaproteobacteria bacterium]|nr:hypothetical protein [Alphaproteobacteria bacterium]